MGVRGGNPWNDGGFTGRSRHVRFLADAGRCDLRQHRDPAPLRCVDSAAGRRPFPDSPGESLAPYYEPQYDCKMEILRFYSWAPNPRYAVWIEQMKTELTGIQIIARDRRHQDWSCGYKSASPLMTRAQICVTGAQKLAAVCFFAAALRTRLCGEAYKPPETKSVQVLQSGSENRNCPARTKRP